MWNWGWYRVATVKIKRDMPAILAKVQAGSDAMVIAVTEAVIEYGNRFVREDQGTLMKSALIKKPPKGRACYLGSRR